MRKRGDGSSSSLQGSSRGRKFGGASSKTLKIPRLECTFNERRDRQMYCFRIQLSTAIAQATQRTIRSRLTPVRAQLSQLPLFEHTPTAIELSASSRFDRPCKRTKAREKELCFELSCVSGNDKLVRVHYKSHTADLVVDDADDKRAWVEGRRQGCVCEREGM